MVRLKKTVVSFCVGTGRCGTTFLAELGRMEPSVAASHERLRLPACYHMFCKWHGISSDPEGFLMDRERAIEQDLEAHHVSFEASALLSHSILELFERFDARFLLLVRRPDATVASFAVRGWFLDPIPWGDPLRPPTIPEGVEPRHFFGRNLPRGTEEFERWTKLSQIGKLGWFWNARNRAIVDQLAQLPSSHRRICRLEDLDFDHYREVAAFLGWNTEMARTDFDALADRRPNAGPNIPLDPRAWPVSAVAEFEREVGTLASALGYEHRIARLMSGAEAVVKTGAGVSRTLVVEEVVAALGDGAIGTAKTGMREPS